MAGIVGTMSGNLTQADLGGGPDLSRRRVVYISHNGIETALVQSQVLPYLERLESRGFAFDLITFERSQTRAAPRPGWWPIRARTGQCLLAKAIDIARGILRATLLGRRAAIFHARSYVPAAIAAVAGAITRRPYVFDMRGFLPEEYVDAGNWTDKDLRYRVLCWAETRLLRRASEIVVLTNAAADRLRTEPRYRRAIGETRLTVIPCAVDLDRFRPLPERDDVPTLIYSGSLGSFYELHPMLEVYRSARKALPRLRFLFVTRADPELVLRASLEAGLRDADVVVRSAAFSEMPEIVGRAHVGIALVRQRPSKLGSSAIKIAEYLAVGLPVIVNAGLGDIDRQILSSGAGHVMTSFEEIETERAGRAVADLTDDATARIRARTLAEREYGLESAVLRYAEVYSRLVRPSSSARAPGPRPPR